MMKKTQIANADFRDMNTMKLTGVYEGEKLSNAPSKERLLIQIIGYNHKAEQGVYLPNGTYVERYFHKGNWTPWRKQNDLGFFEPYESGDE